MVPRPSLRLSCRLRSALKENGTGLQNVGRRLQTTGANAVGTLFVLLNSLETQTKLIGELS